MDQYKSRAHIDFLQRSSIMVETVSGLDPPVPTCVAPSSKPQLTPG